MPNYKVKPGDCISSIAYKSGFYWETIWEHANNAELKRRRENPNALQPGDAIFIPDKVVKEVEGVTETLHSFKLKDVPVKLKVQILVDDEPQSNKPYQIEIDGDWREGTTDGDGFIEEPLSPGARRGKILMSEGDNQDIYEFDLGFIDPIDTNDGVRGRLTDLGFNAESEEALTSAIRDFQEKEDLEVTGEMNDATRSKLKEKFGQ